MDDPGSNELLNPTLVFIEHQQRLIDAAKAELHISQEKLKHTLRLHSDIFYHLFPPIRPGRDAAAIQSRIDESRKELGRLRQAIFDQRLELESLLQSPFASKSSITPKAPLTTTTSENEILNKGRGNLEKLKKEFIDTRLNLEKLEAMLSPIRLLPMEILGEVFSHCLPQIAYEPMSVHSGPLLMTHVCSLWRSTAINKPSLWSDICVMIKSNEIKTGWPALVRLWVERSKQMPLTIRIYESQTHDYRLQPDSVFFDILDILSPHYSRWKSIDLLNRKYRSRSERLWFPNISDNIEFFPRLEKFCLNTQIMEANELQRLTDMLRLSPHLHDAAIFVKTSPTVPSLPWSQLSHLSLELLNTSVGQVYDLVSSCPLLQALDISLQTSNGARPPLAKLTHKILRAFCITCEGNMDPIIFDLFTLPNLEDLSINQMPANLPDEVVGLWPHGSILAFLQRSTCKLRKLTMFDVVVYQDIQLLDILRHVSPTLSELKIHNFNQSYISDNLLKLLTYPDPKVEVPESGGVLCPALEVLRLHGCLGSTDGILADMVLSRLQCSLSHPSLQRLKQGDFGAQSPPPKVVDQERLRDLAPHIRYTVNETYY